LAANENFSQCNASSTSLPPLSNCIFNDVTMGNNVVPGQSPQNYLSAPGYDLATGLGSVNVANLVNNWNMPISTGTTTSLSLNNGKAVTITHGASVPVQIQVTPMSGSAAPSGDVALGATLPSSQQQGVGVFTLNSAGSVSSSTQLLPGGSYNVAAHYSGNGNFLPSDSNAAPVTVNPEPSTTAINAETLDQNFKFQTFTTGPYGSFVYLVADVTGSSGQGIPTGSVNFVDAGANGNLGLFPLNSQGNTATPNFVNSPVGGSPSGLFSLAVGSHSLTASYLGDNSFNSSASSPLNLSITPAATTTNVTSAGAPQGATLTATVGTNSGGNAPSGTVTFSINGNPVGTPVSISVSVPATTNRMTGALLGVQGIASFTDTTLANGQYALSATYSGDTNYIGSSSVATPITVRPDFVLSANATVVAVSSAGGSGSLMLTIGFNDGFNGTVQFSCAGLPAESTCNFSPATIASSGTITLNVTTSGPHQVASLKLGSTHAWMASSVILFGAILLIGLPQRRYRWTSLLTLVMLAFLLAIVGCGGGNATPPPPPRTDPGTPAGTSNVIVTAASGSLSHSVSFTLIVP
jgi:Bacterial Ig-like domain (group 3)